MWFSQPLPPKKSVRFPIFLKIWTKLIHVAYKALQSLTWTHVPPTLTQYQGPSSLLQHWGPSGSLGPLPPSCQALFWAHASDWHVLPTLSTKAKLLHPSFSTSSESALTPSLSVSGEAPALPDFHGPSGRWCTLSLHSSTRPCATSKWRHTITLTRIKVKFFQRDLHLPLPVLVRNYQSEITLNSLPEFFLDTALMWTQMENL